MQGLDRYYDLRTTAGFPAQSFRKGTYYWLDDLIAKNPPTEGQPLRLTLDIQGVHCAACVWLLEELFRRHPGGLSLRINPSLGKADIIWNPAAGELREYLREVERFGYRFGPSLKTARPRSRGLLIRLAVSVAAAMNVMIFSLCYYFGLSAADGWIYTVVGQVSAVLTTIAVLVGGWVFVRSVWIGIRHGLVHLDLPIALGIVLAYGGSMFAYFRWGPEATYFDTVTIFVTLMLLGRWLQERVIERNRNTLLSEDGVDHLFARRVRDGRLETVPAVELHQGDEILVVPGDLVPVTGRVSDRAARVSLDWITGESDPRTIDPGDNVPAGAFNAARSTLRMIAIEDFADSQLNDLLQSPRLEPIGNPDPGPDAARVRDTASDRDHRSARAQRWWSRISKIYVIAVLTLAATGFLLFYGQGLNKALEVTIALLVVTCPCAIGLAVPLAQELVQVALRRSGVFVRSSGFMERALSIRKILFDKTGTLTMGRLELDSDSRARLHGLDPSSRAILYNMAVRSNHPVSRAIVAAIDTPPVPAPQAAESAAESPQEPPTLERAGDGILERDGMGLEWRFEDHLYRFGRPGFALEPADIRSDVAGVSNTTGDPNTPGDSSTPDPSHEGQTLFTRDGDLLAAFGFNEELKPDAREEIAHLESEGFEIYLLSGDIEEKARTVAAVLGIKEENALGGLTPDAKSRFVEELDRQDTLMVGDGLNDAPSFEKAYAAATPAVDLPTLPARADFYFLGEGVGAVRRALTAAHRLRSVIRGNLFLAVLYNVIVIGLCFAGRVNPVTAAILMPLSSLSFVLLTTYRLSGGRLRWMS